MKLFIVIHEAKEIRKLSYVRANDQDHALEKFKKIFLQDRILEIFEKVGSEL